MLKSDWGCLSVHVLESVFMVDLRWLRKCRAVGRVSVLAGCRTSLLPLGLPALRGVSRGLRNFQKCSLSLSLLFLCFFPQEKLVHWEKTSTTVIPAVLHSLLSSPKLLLCVHSCHSVLMCYVWVLLHSREAL